VKGGEIFKYYTIEEVMRIAGLSAEEVKCKVQSARCRGGHCRIASMAHPQFNKIRFRFFQPIKPYRVAYQDREYVKDNHQKGFAWSLVTHAFLFLGGVNGSKSR
jgi:hypothetical protein